MFTIDMYTNGDIMYIIDFSVQRGKMNQISGSAIKSQIAQIQADAESGNPTIVTSHGRVTAIVMPPEWAWLYENEAQERLSVLRKRYSVATDIEVVRRLLSEDTLREILSEIKGIKNALSVD